MSSVKEAIRRRRSRSQILRRPLTLYRYRGLNANDVLLATFPRSGTTWMRFMVYEILSGEPAEFGMINDAIPYVGQQEKAPRWFHGEGRLLQTHEPLCDRDRKVVYVARDPRSVVVSQYYWLQRRALIEMGLNDFVPDWVKGRTLPYGRWDRHVEYWLDSKPARNGRLHLVKYEDLRHDPKAQLKGVLAFLDIEAEDGLIDSAIENSSLERMREKEDRAPGMKKARRADIRFVRAGSVAGWKEELSSENEQLIVQRYGKTLTRLGYALAPSH